MAGKPYIHAFTDVLIRNRIILIVQRNMVIELNRRFSPLGILNIPGLMSPPVRKTETVIPDKKKLQIPDFGNRLDL
jgi:hypothetical protein